MTRKLLIVLTVLSMLVMAAVPALAEEMAEEQGPYKVGDMAKDLTVTDESGQTVDLLKVGSNSRKAIVFLNTACSACKAEMSAVQNILAGKPVDILVVATDMGSFEMISNFRDSAQYPGMWYQDADFVTPTKFGFFFTPALVVLDDNGKVLLSSGGYNKRKAKAFESALLDAIK